MRDFIANSGLIAVFVMQLRGFKLQRHVYVFFDVMLTVHLSIFILVINQLDAQNFCFTISFWYAGAYAPAYQTVIYTEYTRRPPIGVIIPETV